MSKQEASNEPTEPVMQKTDLTPTEYQELADKLQLRLQQLTDEAAITAMIGKVVQNFFQLKRAPQRLYRTIVQEDLEVWLDFGMLIKVRDATPPPIEAEVDTSE